MRETVEYISKEELKRVRESIPKAFVSEGKKYIKLRSGSREFRVRK